VIVSGLMLPDVDDLAATACEWCRVVRPGGIIVCSTLHPVGAALGWTRTFDTPYGTRTLPAQWHTLADHQRAAAAAGLVVDTVREPVLDSRHRAPAAPHVPVALVLRLRRPV
jgi:malonyl-CoA O-methyltransferase